MSLRYFEFWKDGKPDWPEISVVSFTVSIRSRSVELFPQKDDEGEKKEETEPMNHSPALLDAVKRLEERGGSTPLSYL